jgi:hypothetical protein
MRCEEIRERFIDLLYDEHGTPPASPELRAHIDSCPMCQQELQGLRGVQESLRGWKDEELLRPVSLPRHGREISIRSWTALKFMRYAAIAAMLVISFLALANAEISLGKFTFKTHLFPRSAIGSEYYTRAEVRDLLKRALDDTEFRMIETNQLMIQQLMGTLDQERVSDLRMIRNLAFQNRGKN